MSEAPRRRTRLERLADLIARSMGKGWDQRADGAARTGQGPSSSTGASPASAGSAPSSSSGSAGSANSADPADRAHPTGSPRRQGAENVSTGRGGATRTRSGARGSRGPAQRPREQVTSRLTLERVESMLLSLGHDDLASLVADGKAEVCCHFCGEKYAFTREDLEALLAEKERAAKG